MKLALIFTLSMAVLAGCAKRPGSIAAADLPDDTYAAYSCERLGADLASEQKRLTALSRKQHDAATGDAFTVFMIGLPVASLAGGDSEAEISISKGRIAALDRARLRNGCA
jgi:hypothetical protein